MEALLQPTPIPKMEAVLEHIITHYRWVFVLLLLPVSFVYDIYFYTRNWWVFRMSSAPEEHIQKVQTIQDQVRKWKVEGQDQVMCTARPGTDYGLRTQVFGTLFLSEGFLAWSLRSSW
jgi:hypothetical protein